MITIIVGDIEEKRYIYKVCKCGKIKEKENRPYCTVCSNDYYSASKKIIKDRDKISDDEVLKFVNIVKDRNEFMSLEEIFVKLICYFDKIANTELKGEIDILSTKDQLLIMWSELKKWSDKKETNI